MSHTKFKVVFKFARINKKLQDVQSMCLGWELKYSAIYGTLLNKRTMKMLLSTISSYFQSKVVYIITRITTNNAIS